MVLEVSIISSGKRNPAPYRFDINSKRGFNKRNIDEFIAKPPQPLFRRKLLHDTVKQTTAISYSYLSAT
jgi:hypothetical protein